MAVRRWAVRPDPETGMVNREELVQAILDGEALLWRAGGVLTVLPGRAQTDIEGEMVTTSALLEWKDRTDARSQPETAGEVLPQPAPAEPLDEPEPLAADELPPPADAAAFVELPEEDDSSIEPALR
jgi:hypothetical protein